MVFPDQTHCGCWVDLSALIWGLYLELTFTGKSQERKQLGEKATTLPEQRAKT